MRLQSGNSISVFQHKPIYIYIYIYIYKRLIKQGRTTSDGKKS